MSMKKEIQEVPITTIQNDVRSASDIMRASVLMVPDVSSITGVEYVGDLDMGLIIAAGYLIRIGMAKITNMTRMTEKIGIMVKEGTIEIITMR